jgi:tetratricopeptide (TPR) repeat protein
MDHTSRPVTEKARREATALVKKGNALIERGAFAEAAAAFRRALDLVPGHSEAGFNLGAALAEAGRTDEAEAAFRRLIAGKPDVAAAHAALAGALDAHRIARFEPGLRLQPTEALDRALAGYRRAVDAVPMLYGCHKALGELYMNAGRLGDAEAAFATAETYPADLPGALLDLGATMRHPGNLPAALALHRKAGRLAYPLAQWWLGFVLAKHQVLPLAVQTSTS